jgi:hypothetical protein
MRTSTHAALRAALLTVAACGAAADEDSAASDGAVTAPSAIVLQLDAKIPAPVSSRIESLVRSTANGVRVTRVGAEVNSFSSGDHVLAIGDVAAARSVIHDDEARAIPSEGFIVRSIDRNGAHIMAARGTDSKDATHYARPNRGLLYGAYAALEATGFGFLHPLAPTKPAQFAIPNTPIDQHESPRWHVRGLHLHTQHPIELANLLNGWGKTGTNDQAGFEAMVPEWDSFLEWMIANRQNRVEWSLLESKSWESFSMSETRGARLETIVDHAHAWGIDAGADTPIALSQQHAFRLVVKQGELADELASIQSRVGWLMKAGFDFVSTENGTTEFTHADPDRMIAWMNELTRVTEDVHHRTATIKIHCSTGQTADGYTDPSSGQPLNVNMLPHFADKRLGVMPHTVEHYGVDDPAPTYGNTTFDYMRKFLRQEAGHRETIWHPETAYWVSFDIDVPLFLPLYGERRVHDLRLLAKDEHGQAPMDGQMIFSSGWEWGYWLNDVVAARAAWNPHEEAASDEDATRAILDDTLASFGPNKKPVIDAILGFMKDERDLLILGKHDGQAPSDIVSRNGQAYLQGWEVWDDLPASAAKLGIHAPKTQPDKLGLVDMRNPAHSGPNYTREIEPLLAATEKQLGARAEELATALRAIEPTSKELADELTDSARITVLRAKQVHGLYDYVDGYWASLNPFSDAGHVRKERLRVARAALDDAQKIVQSREQHYRVEQSRIGGWHEGPTTYNYGYLWSVHSLLYWWRDEGKAVDAPASPCYLNMVSPAEVAFGEGTLDNVLTTIQKIFGSDGGFTECLAAPTSEPHFPQDDLRSRP